MVDNPGLICTVTYNGSVAEGLVFLFTSWKWEQGSSHPTYACRKNRHKNNEVNFCLVSLGCMPYDLNSDITETWAMKAENLHSLQSTLVRWSIMEKQKAQCGFVARVKCVGTGQRLEEMGSGGCVNNGQC